MRANAFKRLAGAAVAAAVLALFSGCDFLMDDGVVKPSLNDFIISGTGIVAYDGAPKVVHVIAMDGKTTGEITVYYDGANGTDYPKTSVAPALVGEYFVTFDVTSTKDYDKLTNAQAGLLTIIEGMPVFDHFNVSGTGTVYFDGEFKTVDITPKDGKTTGDITVWYAGSGETDFEKSEDAPIYIGLYEITFDVGASDYWDHTSGLSAGTLNIVDGTPDAPTGVNAAIESSESIKVSWSAVPRAESYDVYYITEAGEELTLAGSAEGTSFVHGGLAEDVVYWYYVTAVNRYGVSDYSDYKAVALTKPDAPNYVEATATSSNNVSLRWSSVQGAKNYKVYYNTTGPSGAKSSWANNTYTSTACNVTGLTGGTKYYFYVQAVNAFGESDYSPPGEVTTYANGIYANLRVESYIPPSSFNDGLGWVHLIWNRFTSTNSNYSIYYNIYYTTDSPNNEKILLEYRYPISTYSLRVQPDTRYYFWITIYYNSYSLYAPDQESGFSEMVTQTVGSAAPIPTIPPTTPSVTIPTTPPKAGEKTCPKVFCSGGRCTANAGGRYYCSGGLVTCAGCNGSGTVGIDLSNQRICSSCKGAGKTICSFCRGSGMCPNCKGTGKV